MKKTQVFFFLAVFTAFLPATAVFGLQKPVIVLQTASDIIIYEGEKVTFSAEATGEGVYYQWYKARIGMPPLKLEGWNTASVELEAIPEAANYGDFQVDTGTYWCVAGNNAGTDKTTNIRIAVEPYDPYIPNLWLEGAVYADGGWVFLPHFENLGWFYMIIPQNQNGAWIYQPRNNSWWFVHGHSTSETLDMWTNRLGWVSSSHNIWPWMYSFHTEINQVRWAYLLGLEYYGGEDCFSLLFGSRESASFQRVYIAPRHDTDDILNIIEEIVGPNP